MTKRIAKPSANTVPAAAGVQDAGMPAWMSMIALGNASASAAPADAVLGAITNPNNPAEISTITATTLGAALSSFESGSFAQAAAIWELFLRRDDTCSAAWQKRLEKVCAEVDNWRIQTKDDSDEATRQADFLKAFYNRLTGYSIQKRQIRKGLRGIAEYALSSAPMEYSFLAKEWTGKGDAVTLKLAHVPLWFFKLEKDGNFRFSPGSGSDVAIDPKQWIIGNRSNPIMMPASVVCLLKRLPMAQLSQVLSKWGNPSVYGHSVSAKPGDESYQQLFAAVRAYISGWVGVLTGDAELKTLDAKPNFQSMHLPWISRSDDVLYTLFLGGALSSKAAPDSGKLAGGAQAEDTDDKIRGDLRWFTELCQEQIDKEALLYGLGVKDSPLAWFSCTKADAKDDTVDITTLKDLVSMGAKIPVSHAYDRFNLPEAQEGDEVLTAPVAAAGGAYPVEPVTTDNPDQSAAGAAPAAADLAKTALNGAQIASLVEILRSAANGEIPEAALWPILLASFPSVPEKTLREIADSLKGFTPPAPAAPPAGAANARRTGDQPATPTVVHSDSVVSVMSVMSGRLLPHAIANARPNSGAQRDLDKLHAAALPPVRKALAEAMQPLGAALAAAGTLEAAQAVLAAWKTPAAGTVAIADSVSQTVGAACVRGFVLGRAGRRRANSKGDRPVAPTANAAGIDMRPMPFWEAQRFWSKKKLYSENPDLQGAAYRQSIVYGFQVAGIHDDTVLAQIRDQLDLAVQGQRTVDEFKTKMQGIIDDPVHAETVIRTNLQTAYAWGNYRQLTDPDVLAAFPIWGFDVVKDDDTSDICLPLWRKAYAASDSIWDSLYPPNHFRCRTTVAQFASPEDAESQGFTVETAWPRDPETGKTFMPSPGFEMNVGEVADLDGILPRNLEGGAAAIRDVTAAWADRRGLDYTAELAQIPDAVLENLSRRPDFVSLEATGENRAWFDGVTIHVSQDPKSWHGCSATKTHELGHFLTQDLDLCDRIKGGSPELATAYASDAAAIGDKLKGLFGDDYAARFALAAKSRTISGIKANNALQRELMNAIDPERKLDWKDVNNRYRLASSFDIMGALTNGKQGWGHPSYKDTIGINEATANLLMGATKKWPELSNLAPETMRILKDKAGL